MLEKSNVQFEIAYQAGNRVLVSLQPSKSVKNIIFHAICKKRESAFYYLATPII